MALVQPPAGNSVKSLRKKAPAGSGGSSAPPVLAPPTIQPPQKGGTSEKAQFLKFVKAHPALNGMQTYIWNAASRFGGMTAMQIAAVILAESGGDPHAKSGAGAYGLGQILDNTASPVNALGVPFFRPDHNISQADKENPAFVADYIAWRIGGYMAAKGVNLDDAWRQGYGGDAPGNFVSKFLPKGYVGLGGSTAADAAGKSVDTSAVKAGLTDPFVVGVNKAGKLIVSNTTVAPKNAVMFDGTPLTASTFSQLSRSLDSYFQSYTGGRPSKSTVLEYVKKGWSPYTLTVALSKNKNFKNSPIYKKYAPEYQDAAKSLLGTNDSVPPDLIRSAIVNGWDSQTLQAVLRKRPQYVDSTEFKGNTAALLNVHASIMGNPDNSSMNTIKQAALAGWDANQYAAYLRSQPQYVQSPEYQSKALNFLGSLGLITGQQAVLKKGQANPADNPNPGGFGPLPTDKREPAGKLTNPEDTVATYNG